MAWDPRVRYIEQNLQLQHAGLSANCQGLTGASRTLCTWFNGEYMWHMDRIDEPTWNFRDGEYNRCTLGTTVRAYVLDLGVDRNHQEFAATPSIPNRVVQQVDFSSDAGPGNTDTTNGCANTQFTNSWHGTAVASILAGASVGVARAEIVSVKAYRCSDQLATTASLITAVNWIATNNGGRPAVVNHSGFIPPWGAFLPPAGTYGNTPTGGA